MKANHLRIGNWVNEPFPMQVVSVFRDEIYCDFEGNEGDVFEFKNEDVKPIPLTPEVLEKCGLKNVWIKNSWMVVEDISGGESFGWSMKVRNATYTKEIEFAYFNYLHQLQNLYWCLCGEELQYTP